MQRFKVMGEKGIRMFSENLKIKMLVMTIALFFSSTAIAGPITLDCQFYTDQYDSTQYPDISDGKVKNVILFIGDGMGLAQIYASRCTALGPSGRLYMERLPYLGQMDTYSKNKFITDSAASGTAMATGHKTDNYCIAQLPCETKIKTILEVARDAGLATGLVATSTITHATPASFAAHNRRRSNQAEMAIDLSIANVDVMLGGGKKYWIPMTEEGSSRKDSLNLWSDMVEKGYSLVQTEEEMNAVTSGKLLGLFAPSGLKFKDAEPSLAEMTSKAIEILSQDEDGFFMMVEGSQIDWECHDNEEDKMVWNTLELDLAVKEALNFAKDDGETVVIVTADHECGGLTLVWGEVGGKNIIAAYSSLNHTAVPVPVYSYGPNAKIFNGIFNNIELPFKIQTLLGLDGLDRMDESGNIIDKSPEKMDSGY
jgi:alkaline phosphatase